jgi:acyl-CoA reductase-like NAD-dependent aldehyde dehydrogenase
VTPGEALQATLAAEHAAVSAYAELGGRVSASGSPVEAAALRAAYDVHRERRDELQTLITQRGGQPTPPAAGYRVPAASRRTPELVAVARSLEERAAEAYAQLVATSVGDVRRWAVVALEDAAVRGLGFGAEPEPFPGAPELG